MSTIARRSGSILLVSVLAALFLSLLSGPAEAASYRYWGYYTWTDGAWTFATKGPDQTAPADGAVEGWRFAITAESGSPRVPRADGDFEAICAATDPVAGKKRVAVVIDGGLSDDAPEGATPPEPRGACAQVDESASGAEVLAAVATVRVEKNLVCAIDAYPAQGCGEPVDAEPPTTPDATVALALPKPEQTATTKTSDGDDGGPPWLPIGIVALALAALGWFGNRKARQSRQGRSDPLL
jgi:hypothetical protein